MSARLYVKCKNTENPGRVLTVRVELLPEYNYAIQGGYIDDITPIKINASRTDMIAEPRSRIDLTADAFSKVIAEHGFDENEVRMEIEDTIEGLASQESML